MLNQYTSSPNGNQQSARVRRSNKTSDPLVLPFTAEQLADFLGLTYTPSDDDLLNSLIEGACDYYTSYTNCELLSRQYVLNYSRYPEVQAGYSGLAPMAPIAAPWVSLPICPAISIDEITIDAEVVTDFSARLDDRPATVNVPLGNNGEMLITYTAGYATVDEIPRNVLYGVKLLAAAMYENRGACNPGDMAQASGAAAWWKQTMMILTI